MAGGNLELISTCGKIAASTPVAETSVQTCSTGGPQAVLEPPVSATNDLVFYRDGDTKIRSLTVTGQTSDATTVPGGPTTVSFFSVSPDDRRIAVLVEDLSPASTINLRLYVEDLRGGGHHSDIYSTTLPKSSGATLWPVGWHQGLLVLAVMTACSSDPIGLSPVAWHLVDPNTADRKVSIDSVSCVPGFGLGVLGRWPSTAGVICRNHAGTCLYAWTGTQLACYSIYPFNQGEFSELSPSGGWIFIAGDRELCGSPTMQGRPATCVWAPNPQGGAGVDASDYLACLWIDDDHILAPNAVISSLSSATVIPLPKTGVCVGHYPGGL
jgi:hypothetical protein